MKRIEVKEWKAESSEGEVTENTLKVLSVLINSKKPDQMPRGIDKFRLFSRISKAFTIAEDSGILELEEGDFTFLKKTIEDDIPAAWAMNAERFDAINLFLEAKSVEDEKKG